MGNGLYPQCELLGSFPSDRALNEEKGGSKKNVGFFYVAITRAKTHLHMSLSTCIQYELWSLGGVRVCFLEEIDKNLVEMSGAAGNSYFQDLNDEDEGDYLCGG
jgi:superfamily I DNA/RNA helicase